MKLRSIKRQGGRRPAIPESERKLTTIPHEPPMLFEGTPSYIGIVVRWDEGDEQFLQDDLLGLDRGCFVPTTR